MKTGYTNEPLNAVRAIIRGQMRAGYRRAAICHDGELLCERCVRGNARLILRATRTHDDALLDWQVTGAMNSGDAESEGQCAHCHEILWGAQP